ncbi:unnamed protein product [Prorocentrum cordatum]|uniref:Uncharacterized protein n=1 Tax=Prorocentrum cordatum TaxID=2364126 RepID=A0ABN9X4L8_9DINO|nr:unnamed protein product [Polarella glacialis]
MPMSRCRINAAQKRVLHASGCTTTSTSDAMFFHHKGNASTEQEAMASSVWQIFRCALLPVHGSSAPP